MLAPHVPGPRKRASLLLVAAMVGPTLACSSSSDDDGQARTCTAIQAERYPAVEAVVARTLEGLDYSAQRLNHCEETGHPGSTVLANLPDYKRRRDVVARLTEDGWQLNRTTGMLHSADGLFAASVTKIVDGGATTISIYFSRSV